MWMCNAFHELKPALMMVVTQAALGGINILYKLAMYDGMSIKIIVAYRYLFAAAVMLPLALVVEWNSRPRLTWRIILQGFLCGLFGISLTQNLYAESLALTSATFATAFANLITAFTFILALLFRLEKLAIKTLPGKAKVVGTALSIGGAMILTFYKGAEIKIWSTNSNLLKHYGSTTLHHRVSSEQVLGSILSLIGCICFAVWLIIQTKMNQVYPCYSSAALMCVAGSIQATIYALCTERDWTAWKFGWDIRLLTITYSGFTSGLAVVVMTWCTRVKGALYVSSFYPVMLIFVAIIGSLLIKEQLHLGSIIGSVVIIIGLYIMLWGKGKEIKKMAQLTPSKSSREHEATEGALVISINGAAIRIDD